MTLTFRQLNPHACLTYLIENKDKNESILIDPLLDHVNDYLQLLTEQKLTLTHVIDTHSHADHISGAAALKDHTDCSYIMHEKAPARCVSFRVEDDEKIDIMGSIVKIMYTPGHTKDSISLIFPDRIFTGDALFLDEGGAGRDDLPGGDPGEHYDSIQRFLELPDHLVVYPAHEYRGNQPSSLRKQRDINPHLKPRTREEFVNYLEILKLGPADWMHDVLNSNYACARDPGSVWIPIDSPACEIKGTLEIGVNEQVISSIIAQELKNILEGKQTPVLIDVREKHELTGILGHIPDIVHIPLPSLVSNLKNLSEQKDRDMIIICRSGARAHTAAQILQKDKFSKVFVLEGGMIAWRKLTPN